MFLLILYAMEEYWGCLTWGWCSLMLTVICGLVLIVGVFLGICYILNDCEVGTAKVFIRDSKKEFASKVALNFFSDEYECEAINVKELNHP